MNGFSGSCIRTGPTVMVSPTNIPESKSWFIGEKEVDKLGDRILCESKAEFVTISVSNGWIFTSGGETGVFTFGGENGGENGGDFDEPGWSV